MPDTNVPVAAAVIAPTDVKAVVEPAVPAPKPTIAKPEAILENIKARIAKANAPAPEPVKPAAEAAPAGAEPIKTEPGKEIIPDAKAALAELAKAQAKVKEWQERAKALEAGAADAEFGKAIKAGKTSMEKLQAIAKAEGKDPTDLLADLYAELQIKEAEQGGQKPAQAATGEIKTLVDKLEAMSKKLDALESGKTQDTEAAVKAKAEQQESATKAYLKAIAEKHKDKFEISSRPENIEEAIAKAMAKTPEVYARLGFESPDLTEEQAEQLAAEAIAEAEKEFEQLGKRFGKVTAPVKPRAYDIPLSKPPVRQAKKTEVKSVTGKNWEDYKAEMRSRYDASAAHHFDTGRTYQSAQDGRQAGITR